MLEWASLYDCPGHGADTAYAITASSSGGLFVAGSSTGIASSADYATLSYAP